MRKKLFYAKKVTKLPDLTVPIQYRFPPPLSLVVLRGANQ
jgi:hypothetical protein